MGEVRVWVYRAFSFFLCIVVVVLVCVCVCVCVCFSLLPSRGLHARDQLLDLGGALLRVLPGRGVGVLGGDVVVEVVDVRLVLGLALERDGRAEADLLAQRGERREHRLEHRVVLLLQKLHAPVEVGEVAAHDQVRLELVLQGQAHLQRLGHQLLLVGVLRRLEELLGIVEALLRAQLLPLRELHHRLLQRARVVLLHQRLQQHLVRRHLQLHPRVVEVDGRGGNKRVGEVRLAHVLNQRHVLQHGRHKLVKGGAEFDDVLLPRELLQRLLLRRAPRQQRRLLLEERLHLLLEVAPSVYFGRQNLLPALQRLGGGRQALMQRLELQLILPRALCALEVLRDLLELLLVQAQLHKHHLLRAHLRHKVVEVRARLRHAQRLERLVLSAHQVRLDVRVAAQAQEGDVLLVRGLVGQVGLARLLGLLDLVQVRLAGGTLRLELLLQLLHVGHGAVVLQLSQLLAQRLHRVAVVLLLLLLLLYRGHGPLRLGLQAHRNRLDPLGLPHEQLLQGLRLRLRLVVALGGGGSLLGDLELLRLVVLLDAVVRLLHLLARAELAGGRCLVSHGDKRLPCVFPMKYRYC
eukprot:Rhum_TRINITY_DN14932_c7_g2::Rhum_TRINITY_DN14932_c7_g2_i1::g.129627::m.129627